MYSVHYLAQRHTFHQQTTQTLERHQTTDTLSDLSLPANSCQNQTSMAEPLAKRRRTEGAAAEASPSPSQSTLLLHLSDDVMLQILQNLSSMDLITLALTCKRFQSLCLNTESLWRHPDFSNHPMDLRSIKKWFKFLNSRTETLALEGFLKTSRGQVVNISQALLGDICTTCDKLKELKLSNVYYHGDSITFQHFPKTLTHLSFEGCEVDNLPTDISYFKSISLHLPLLETLNLQNCGWVKNHCLMAICKLENLKTLNLRGCFRIGECFAYTALALKFGFNSIEKFDLRDTDMSDMSLACFRKPSLRELCVGGEYGENITNSGILNLCDRDSRLSRLTIDNCAITDEALSILLNNLTHLTFLDIRNCGGLTSDGVKRAKLRDKYEHDRNSRMRKIKTKAELKSVGDFLKTSTEMLPLTCGLCDKDFNSESHFKDHEADHPSVEIIPRIQKPPPGRKDLKCPICSKKFKNETSLNYHQMFHTNDEIPLTNKTLSTSKPVKKTGGSQASHRSKEDKKPSRSASFDSSDSDSDNESRHLSLKHISNSVKRISEEKQKNVKKFPKMKPKISESESEVEVEVKKMTKVKLECENCRKKFSSAMALEYHKITFHVGDESSHSGEKKSKGKQPVTKQKISPNKTDTNKSKCLTGIFRKTQKQSDHSEDDSKQVIETIKSKLFMMQKKTFSSWNFESRKRQSVNYKDDSSSSESRSDRESQAPTDLRKNVKRKAEKSSRPVKKRFAETSSDSDEEPVAKKPAKKVSKEKPRTIESEFQSHSIDAILRSKDDVRVSKKLPSKSASKLLKSSAPSAPKSKAAKKVTSDSEPEIVKKEIKTEPVVDIVDSEDESSKIRERLFSTTSVKEKCENCSKNFKNLLTLRYHQLHCDASTKITSNASKNSVEKSILQIKKTSESPADKILKKLSEKVEKSETKSAQSQPNKPRVKACGVQVKKISKGMMKTFEADIDKKVKAAPPPKAKIKSAELKIKKQTQRQTQRQTSLKPVKSPAKKKLENSPGGCRVRCEDCGKTFAGEMALQYHKITFHVGEEESKLFSTSIYNEQMNFDKTVLKMNEIEASLVISDPGKSPKTTAKKSVEVEKKEEQGKPAKQEKRKFANPSPKVDKDKLKKKKVSNISNETSKMKPTPKVKTEPAKVSVKSSPGYCFCNKPEREDMLGCDFCDEWYHPECIGVDEKQAIQLTHNQSWKCPKCVEEDFNKRKKLVKTPVKLSAIKSSYDSKKLVHPKKKLLQKKYLSEQDSSSSDSDTSPAPRKRMTVKRPLKKKKRKVSESSETSESESSGEESDAEPGKIIRIPVDSSQLDTYYK